METKEKALTVKTAYFLVNHYTLSSESMFPILFFIHFLGCCQQEFVEQSRGSLVADPFSYPHDLNV